MANPSGAITGQGTLFKVVAEATTSTQYTTAPNKLIRTTGSWITDGFVLGMTITTTETTGNNEGPLTPTVITALEITVAETLSAVAAASQTVTGKITIGEIQTFDGPGGSAKVIDVTTLESSAIEKRIGLPDEGQFSFDCNLVPNDVSQSLLQDLRSAQSLSDFELTFTDADVTAWTFSGYVLEFKASGGVNDVIKGAVTIEITGAVVRA